MKKIYFFLILLMTCSICHAQNLVPNSSFEQFLGCPTGMGQIDSSLSWFNLAPLSSSPDYFHQCANHDVNVPNSFYGYQVAHGGGAFSGIVLWAFPYQNFNRYREYLEVELLSSLTAGVCYHFEMYANAANAFPYATDKLGAYFSNAMITSPNYHNLPHTPQIVNTTGFITDTLNWVLIEGDYTALGGEDYLIIGNFSNDVNTDTMRISNTGFTDAAYVYIDDISLTSCAVGINEPGINGIQVYPNPFLNSLNIQLNDDEPSVIILRDITGREVMRKDFTNGISINTEQLAKGMYIYEVMGRDGHRRTGKVVKE